MSARLAKAALFLSLLGSAGALRAQAPAQQNSADQTIQSLELHVRLYPRDFAGYDGLGAAFLQKGRETGDADYYERAKTALAKSLELESSDPAAYSAMTHMAVACMAEHRFRDALAWAQRALALGSGDPSPWAIAGDALADMGEYDTAAAAYGNLQNPLASEEEQRGLSFERNTRHSSLEQVAGHTRRAIELMRTAVHTAIETHMSAENIAWSEYQFGEELFQTGDYTAAERADGAALDEYPSYYRALGGLAKALAAQGKLEEAAEYYRRALAVVPFPEYAAALGDVYSQLGRPEEARKEYDLVEFIGHLSEINQEIHNRDLAYFYADHDLKIDQALLLARKELEVRRDIYTWDVLAWALYKNGKLQEAADAAARALQPGSADALILFHAGMIQERLGNLPAAKAFLQRALNLSPQFNVRHAETARDMLAGMQAPEAQSASVAPGEVSHAR
jgi:tetratricopeptide (TPR) repeat protein